MDQKRCKAGYAGTNVMYNSIFSNVCRDIVSNGSHNITTTKVTITHTSVQNGNLEGVNQILSTLSLGAQTGQLGLSRIM